MKTHSYLDGRTFQWWWYFSRTGQLYVELSGLTKSFGAGIEFEPGGDRDITLSLRLWLFSVYVGVSAKWARALVGELIGQSYEGRQIEFRIVDGTLSLDIWAPSMSWSSRDPWWMRFRWTPMDSFFGRMEHSEAEVERLNSVIPMPEAVYPCEVVMKDETWKRPRLPWPSHRTRRAHIDCKKGVPFPGKGENAWDCGDDASYGLTCPAETPEQGIAKFVESVLRSRRRHGGSINWQQGPAQ